MATQSLAMGEAFGKSFQYGKRKISSMSNEEFNKYSMSDMMNEQTINYNMMIPKLHEQMTASQQMQADIFKEMLKIIPTFLNAVVSAINTSTATGNENYLPGFGTIQDPNDSTIVQASQLTSSELTLLSHGDTITSPTSTTKTVSTPDLSVYNTMNLTQLKQARSNADGTLASYLDTLIANEEQRTTDTSIDFTTQEYIKQESWFITTLIGEQKEFYRIKSQHAGDTQAIDEAFSRITNGVNHIIERFAKFYLSYRGTVGLSKLTLSWREHNAKQISYRTWTKYKIVR